MSNVLLITVVIPVLLVGWLLSKLAEKYPPYDWPAEKKRIDTEYKAKLATIRRKSDD